MNKEERKTITEREEFIKICGMLAYSDIPTDDCKHIVRFIVALGKEIEELHNKIDKAIELNNQVIKDTKSFYRPTSDTIYSGDCLIDIAEQNLKILKDSDVDD